ncbi:MAG: hypothetical protein O3A46_09525, partial [Candidatus Poribacteria bacterium]|nr:hypothetical protein [Candidatus Poribacteria bacterium]
LSFILLSMERFVTEFWRLTRVFSFSSTPMGWASRTLRDTVNGTAWDGTLMVNGISEFQFWSLVTTIAGALLMWLAWKRSSVAQDARL